MIKKYDYFVWIDCEMTGLDPIIDEIIEIAVIVTDSELNIIHNGFDCIIKPSQKAKNNMSDFVLDMHKASGLLNKLNTEGIPLKSAENKVLKYIKEYVPAKMRPLLSGNSIASDRKFIDKYMPKLGTYLHYRMIDVSTIKELAKRWNYEIYNKRPQKLGIHRAYDDIFDSINELKYYKTNFIICSEE
jgi:oligoribonuclease